MIFPYLRDLLFTKRRISLCENCLEVRPSALESSQKNVASKPNEASPQNEKSGNSRDTNNVDDRIDYEKVDELIKKQTPMDRLQHVFVTDVDGYPSQERKILETMPVMIIVPITLLNAVLKASYFAEEFISRHKGTAWPTRMVAKRKYNDYVLSRTLVYGAKRGVKLWFLSTSFFVLQCGIPAYRGKSSWWEIGVSGMIVGGAYCMNRGFRGVIAGSVIMGVPATIIGALCHQFRVKTNYTFEEINRRKLIDIMKYRIEEDTVEE